MHREEFRSRFRKVRNDTGQRLKKVAWQACKCAIYAVCAPCLCCALLCLPRSRCNHNRRHRAEPKRPEVPFPRRRAMSLPLIDAQDNQHTLEQPQSEFMTKLPLEIRRIIYAEALGGTQLHVRSYEGRMLVKRCGMADCHCRSFNLVQDAQPGFGLGLLRTCRVIYSEAIEFLYKANAFSLSTYLDDIPTLEYLSYYFLPQRLVEIKDLRICWEIDYLPYYFMQEFPERFRDPWHNLWKVLSGLTGLRRLHVDLVFRYTHPNDFEEFWKDKGTNLLESVKAITWPQEFVVTLPDVRCPTDVDVGDSKCVFKMKSEDAVTAETTG